MKNRSILWIVLIIASFYFIGCSTTPRVNNMPYTFAENENAKGTAIIKFNVMFIDFEGEQLPTPEEGTRWYPLQFPAGRPFNIKVHVYHDGWNSTGGYFDIPYFSPFAVIDKEVIFECPPLEAGKEYRLIYNYSISGKSLDLKEEDIDAFFLTIKGRIIYSQKIE